MKRHSTWILVVGVCLVLTLAVSGCSLLRSSVIGGITGETRRSVEQEVAPESEPASPKAMTPGPQWNQLMVMQAQMAFNYAFSAGGLWAGQQEYNPGEYTRFDWAMKGEKPITMERAYLKKLEDKNQWWRVSWEDSDGRWIWETLLDSKSNQMLRMRARDPDGNEGEVPVTGQRVYLPPTELTAESLQGATVGKERVSVPAGRFDAEHVVFMAATGEQAEFWLAPEVPGGVVKYLVSRKGEGAVWTSQLVEYGKQATTILSSF